MQIKRIVEEIEAQAISKGTKLTAELIGNYGTAPIQIPAPIQRVPRLP